MVNERVRVVSIQHSRDWHGNVSFRYGIEVCDMGLWVRVATIKNSGESQQRAEAIRRCIADAVSEATLTPPSQQPPNKPKGSTNA